MFRGVGEEDRNFGAAGVIIYLLGMFSMHHLRGRYRVNYARGLSEVCSIICQDAGHEDIDSYTQWDSSHDHRKSNWHTEAVKLVQKAKDKFTSLSSEKPSLIMKCHFQELARIYIYIYPHDFLLSIQYFGWHDTFRSTAPRTFEQG